MCNQDVQTLVERSAMVQEGSLYAGGVGMRKGCRDSNRMLSHWGGKGNIGSCTFRSDVKLAIHLVAWLRPQPNILAAQIWALSFNPLPQARRV
jgi:hypothetical protein